jgi:RND family efflux transporter MFP subunit
MKSPHLALVLLLAGCGDPPAPPVGPNARPPVERPAAPPPEPGFIGVIVAGESAELEPRVDGRIDEVLVRAGDTVARGQPLARLDGKATRHDLAGARAALAEASRRLARRTRLAREQEGAVTAEEIDAARRDVLESRARVAKLSEASADAQLVAPFDGTVAETYLSAGALSGPGRPVVRLVGKSPPRVRFAVPPERVSAVRLGKIVGVEIVAPGAELRARVTGLNPEVDGASGLVHGAATFEPEAAGDDRLATGVIARVIPPATGRP